MNKLNKKPKILVVGSFVMDLIVTTERFSNAGESVIGTGFSTAPGGKGANQAVQAARLGADVTMVGCVGNDDFGKLLIKSANDSGVNTEYVLVSEKSETAVGNVQIQKNANGTENRIIVVLGANFDIKVEQIEFLKNLVIDFDMVILQNEIPMEINLAVAKYAKKAGVAVMFNPAPSGEIPKELIECLTYITPNEHEAADISKLTISDEASINCVIDAIHKLGAHNVIVTCGKNGCVYSDKKSIIKSPCIDVAPVIDPTAAGDSFIGAFCTAVANGVEVQDALVFANCTAGITVSRMGAQTSLPTLSEVLAILEEKGIKLQKMNNLLKVI